MGFVCWGGGGGRVCCGLGFFRVLFFFSEVYPSYSRAYMVVGGFGGKVKVAAAGGKTACDSKE